tara:strand:+ start:1498 stop:1737 length:240 start_codon:yes stop_codon:yes gene_type:complete
MHVGDKVYCKSTSLGLDNDEGVVNRLGDIMGTSVSCTVLLQDGRQVAFFGNQVQLCVSTAPHTTTTKRRKKKTTTTGAD